MDFEINSNTLVKYSGTEKDITVPDGITFVADRAFAGCDVVSVVFPCSVKEIGKEVFVNCSNLESVVIGNGTEKIGEHAFKNCINLTTAKIPATVMSIGENAFEGCEEVVIYSEARCYADEYAAEKELGFDPGSTL